MASKTISITEEVYEMLTKLKLPQESFGDVIKRLCLEKSAKNLLQFIEINTLWSDMSEDEIDHIADSHSSKFTIHEVNLE